MNSPMISLIVETEYATNPKNVTPVTTTDEYESKPGQTFLFAIGLSSGQHTLFLPCLKDKLKSNDIVVYESGDGVTHLSVWFDGETV